MFLLQFLRTRITDVLRAYPVANEVGMRCSDVYKAKLSRKSPGQCDGMLDDLVVRSRGIKGDE